MTKTTINWYELNDHYSLYLKHETFRSIVANAASKSGSLSKLCIALNSMQFYSIQKGNNGISVKNLKKLLNYTTISYDSLNKEILELRKGKIVSLSNPLFPINLLHDNVGSIVGHIVSDGCLYYDQSRNDLIRTKYCSEDQECLDHFISDITSVFGKAHYNSEHERNCTIIRFGSSIIGKCLRYAGVPVGKKYKLNSDLPWIITAGNLELKRNYLRAIFDDEGSVGKNPFPYLILSRNIHINLSKSEEQILHNLIVPLMKKNTFPTGHTSERISIGLLRKTLSESNYIKLLNKLNSCQPQLLRSESKILSDFGIKCHIYTMSLQRTTLGFYSVQSTLVVRNKKDVISFYDKVGFRLKRKQYSLKDALLKSGWITNGTENSQYPYKQSTAV